MKIVLIILIIGTSSATRYSNPKMAANKVGLVSTIDSILKSQVNTNARLSVPHLKFRGSVG